MALPEDIGDVRGHPVGKVTAAEGHHDGDADTLLCGILQTLRARLKLLVEVIILNLTEIPVIRVEYLLKELKSSVERETYMPDSAAVLLPFQKVEDAEIEELLPARFRECNQHIVINSVRAEPFQLLVEDFFHVFGLFYMPGREFCRQKHSVPVSARKSASEKSLAFSEVIVICRVYVVNARIYQFMNYLRCGSLIYAAVGVERQTHCTETECGKFVPRLGVDSVKHIRLHLFIPFPVIRVPVVCQFVIGLQRFPQNFLSNTKQKFHVNMPQIFGMIRQISMHSQS